MIPPGERRIVSTAMGVSEPPSDFELEAASTVFVDACVPLTWEYQPAKAATAPTAKVGKTHVNFFLLPGAVEPLVFVLAGVDTI